MASVSINWYWPGRLDAGQDGQFRIGPHTDFGSLTILDREPGVGGLQVLDEDGTLALTRMSRDGLEVISKAEILTGRAWTVPTLVGTTLYIRNREEIKALDLAAR